MSFHKGRAHQRIEGRIERKLDQRRSKEAVTGVRKRSYENNFKKEGKLSKRGKFGKVGMENS